MALKEFIAAIANRSGFLDLYGTVRRKITGSQVAILVFHRIAPESENWFSAPLSPQKFEKQILYFKNNYEVLPLEVLVENIKSGRPLRGKAVVITMDDGNKDNYRYAYPILKKHNLPATVFISTGYIGTGKLFWWHQVEYAIRNTFMTELQVDGLGRLALSSETLRRQTAEEVIEKLNEFPEAEKNRLIAQIVKLSRVSVPDDLSEERILNWDEILEMEKNGISFGAHTVTHPILTRVSLEQAKIEISQSRKDIEQRLGHKVNTFAYPNGLHNSQIIEIVREGGFTCAVTVLPERLIKAGDNVFALNRINPANNRHYFKAIFSGFWNDMQLIKHRR